MDYRRARPMRLPRSNGIDVATCYDFERQTLAENRRFAQGYPTDIITSRL